jgi:RNA polymerase sigma-70 factor (ECF subfamily)
MDKAGESEQLSFLDLVKKHEGIIFKLVNLYARDQEEKKDLVQEIMYQAWKGFAKFEGRSSFSTWLYRICLNTILTIQRKKQVVTYRDDLEELNNYVEESVTGSVEAKMLYKAIRSLPETDRALISLHLDGYEHAEIAEIIGLSEGNVRVKLHRIKKTLTNRLNG